ncbi:MAG TPA: DinB family protein [Terriglobales bacterium]|nr:DinB family protein [Terriglobales bacterium]
MIRCLICALALLFSVSALAEDQKPAPTLKSILLEQLRSTHNNAEWFVPINTAVEGLTAEQANWSDGKNHSVGQLVNHLLYWDKRALEKFKGQPEDKYSGNNDDTFKFEPKQWNDSVKELDQVMTDWEKAVEAADDAKLKDSYSTIAHIGTHNAYHIGEIVMVRKEQGSWNPEKGVK